MGAFAGAVFVELAHHRSDRPRRSATAALSRAPPGHRGRTAPIEQADVDALVTAVGTYRDLAASEPLRPWTGREVFPGPGRGGRAELERLVRSTATTYWHQCGTNAMGGDAATSVVDARLAVHGVERLRVVDASVMPRITTGNIMAPCVVIGERASDVLRADHATS